jgi:hypothetical protein
LINFLARFFADEAHMVNDAEALDTQPLLPSPTQGWNTGLTKAVTSRGRAIIINIQCVYRVTSHHKLKLTKLRLGEPLRCTTQPLLNQYQAWMICVHKNQCKSWSMCGCAYIE